MKQIVYRVGGRVLCAAMAWFFLGACTKAIGAQPSAQEVLDKSQVAMGPPIQYVLRTNGIDMLVSQKKLADGSLAMRAETSLPFPKVSLVIGDESYDIYPEKRIVIDTQFMRHAAKLHATTISSPLTGAGATQSAKITGTVQRDGKDCFEIETLFPAAITALATKSLPDAAKKMVPKGYRFVISTDTYTMIEMEPVSQTNERLLKSEFKDIKRQLDLPDELFLLPDGFEIQKPKSISEYTALLTKALMPQLAALPPSQPPSSPPGSGIPSLRPVKIDPKTGRVVHPLPPGISQHDFDALVAQKIEKLLAAKKSEPEATRLSTPRIIGIAVSLVAVVVLFGMVAARRLSAHALWKASH